MSGSEKPANSPPDAEDGAAVLQKRRTNFIFGRPVATPEPDGPVAPQAGAELRSARERLDWRIEDAASELRIGLGYLRALEAGDVAALPATAYAIGYVRTYAAALGLSPDEMVRRFRLEASEVSERTELEFPVPMPERGLPAGAMALLGIVLAIGVYVGWYRLSGEGRLPAETVTAIPSRLAPLAEQAIPPAAAVIVQNPALPAGSVGAQRADSQAPVMPMSVSPSSAAAAPVNPQAAPASIAGPAPQPALDQPRLMLRATSEAWMQVKERNGAVLLNRVMKAGETWPVPAKANLLLATGNAAGTEVVFDGVAIPNLGGTGSVRRDLILDPDQIKDGKLQQLIATPVAAARQAQ